MMVHVASLVSETNPPLYCYELRVIELQKAVQLDLSFYLVIVLIFFFFFFTLSAWAGSSLDSPKITQRVRVCKST